MGSPEQLMMCPCQGVDGAACQPQAPCSAGMGGLGDPEGRGCTWGCEKGRVATHSWSWPQVGGQVCTTGCSCARGEYTHTHTPDRVSLCKSGHSHVGVCTDPQWDKDRAARGSDTHNSSAHRDGA